MLKFFKFDKKDINYDFYTIDFETANNYEFSPIQVAIVGIKNNKCTILLDTLINPGNDIFWDDMNYSIHGISEKNIQSAPTVEKVFREISEILDNNLVFAHNAVFDIKILREGYSKFNIKKNFKYGCSLQIARRTFKNLINYRLDTLADNLNLKFNHHNASDDASICANIILKSIEINNASNINEMLDSIKYLIGNYDGETFTKAYSKRLYAPGKITDKERAEVNIDETIETEISGQRIVFTGTLSIPRSEAMILCGKNGAIPQPRITKDTNILVVGRNDYNNFKTGNKSNKMLKAEELIKKGQNLEIIDETDFINLLEIR